ncbi:MAG: GTP cyclohydrolase II [Spirochaetia bacterium]
MKNNGTGFTATETTAGLKQYNFPIPPFIKRVKQRMGSCKDLSFIDNAKLPTKYGLFTILCFQEAESNREHTAVYMGNVENLSDCPVRIHSQCHTGDVWGSMRCDCGEQLEAAMEYVSKKEKGCIVYLSQEGRGIGLGNKIRAYNLQDNGLDTCEANTALGFPEDMRTYRIAAIILNALGIPSIGLLTNNPDKISQLTEAGVTINSRIPLVTKKNKWNRDYLKTKEMKMGHLFSDI